jgi:hypothetical protein
MHDIPRSRKYIEAAFRSEYLYVIDSYGQASLILMIGYTYFYCCINSVSILYHLSFGFFSPLRFLPSFSPLFCLCFSALVGFISSLPQIAWDKTDCLLLLLFMLTACCSAFRFGLDIDLDAPKVRIPLTSDKPSLGNEYFVLDFGHFTLHTRVS